MQIPDFRLDGRVALVTGATRGLGKAMAFGLAKAGAKVVLNYANSHEHAQRTFKEFEAAGYAGALIRANVIDESEVDRMCTEAERQLGPVDIIVCNATGDQPLKPIEEYDWAFYQEMYDFFVKSPFLLTRRTLPHMKKQHWGRIVNITSEVFRRGTHPFSAYVAAKGGQTGWTRAMARELAPWNITVNCVAPGWIRTSWGEGASDVWQERAVRESMLGRWGTPADIANAIHWLVSPQAAFVTGQVLPVNGGFRPA